MRLEGTFFARPGLGEEPARPGVNRCDNRTVMVLGAITEPVNIVAQSMAGLIAINEVLAAPKMVNRLVLGVATTDPARHRHESDDSEDCEQTLHHKREGADANHEIELQAAASSSGSEWNSCHIPFKMPNPTARPTPRIQLKYHIAVVLFSRSQGWCRRPAT